LPLSTSDVRQEVKIRRRENGGGGGDAEPRTVVEAFDDAVEKFGDLPALHQKRVEPVRKVV